VAVLVLVGGCVAAAWPSGSPLVPGTAGSLVGQSRWALLYLVCEACAFGAYLVGAALLDRRAGTLLPVAVLAAAVQLTPLGAPLLLSSDAWTYWDYGRIAAVHDANPYAKSPQDFPTDPAFRLVGRDWRGTSSVYGPAFTLASEPVALATDGSADAAAWTYKALAAAGVLIATALATFLARRRAFACAFVGWNPLLALQFAGGGHNDAWLAALVMAALAVASIGRRQLAGVAWALAILVKWVAVIFLPLRALEARARGRPVSHLGFAAACAIVLGVASWQFGWHWLAAFGPLARNANHETRYALPHRLESLGVPDPVALALFAVGFAVAYAWLLREAWRGRARLGLTAGAALLATPYLAPWYVIWAVPIAAAEDDRVAQALALLLTAYLLRQAVPV
jgi:Glycosyltransferase family 87